jgi:tetratricopeptide (TPR) repeat protein
VSRAIVGALEVHLTPGEARSLGRRAARDAAAYESYLRARVEIMHMSAASADRAIGVLDDALRRSPEDPLLRAGKAYALYQRTNCGGGTDEDLALAESMAAAVLREVPDLSLCHTVLGLVVGTKPGRAAEAVRHIERALDVAPDDMDALTWLSLFSSFTGGTERAAALAGRMIAISPVDPMSYVALWTVHFFDGRFAEALATADQMVALAPDVEGCRFCRIQPLLALGRLEEAAVVAAWAELDRASFWRRHTLLAWRAFRGDRDGVLALLTPEFLESNRRDLQYSALVAEAYAQLGEPESALEWLGNAVRLGYWNHHYLAERDPFLKPLRGDPRLEALMERAREERHSLEEALS